MASTSPPGPTIFSHFLIFSLLSSPRSMKSCWCYTHTKNVFLSPFWSAQLLSTVFLFPSSKQTLLKGVFNESFLIQNGLEDKMKEKSSFPSVHARKKKQKGRENDTKISIKNNISYFHSNKKEENYQHILPFHLLFLGQFYWRIFVYIDLSELLYIPNALCFQKQPPTNIQAYFLHYHLKSTTELTNYQEYIWRYHF